MNVRPLPRPETGAGPAELSGPEPASLPRGRELVLLFATGLAAGAFGGLVGLGGNVILIVLLVGSGKLRQKEAQATSLVVLVFTGLAGGTRYALGGAVDPAAVAALALPAMITTGPGARYASALSDRQLRRAFGAFLLVIAALLLFRDQLHGLARPLGGAAGMAALVATGALSGFASGLLGVGGGSLMVPAMVLLAGFGQHLAQGSSLVAMVPAGASAAWAHWRLGNVVKRLLLPLVPGVLIGAYLGGSLAARIDELVLRVTFAGVLAWTAAWFLRARRGAEREAEPGTPSGI